MLALTLLLAAAAPEAAPAAPPADRPICRRISNQGSRAQSAIVCMTQARWDRLGDESRAYIEALREPQRIAARRLPNN